MEHYQDHHDQRWQSEGGSPPISPPARSPSTFSEATQYTHHTQHSTSKPYQPHGFSPEGYPTPIYQQQHDQIYTPTSPDYSAPEVVNPHDYEHAHMYYGGPPPGSPPPPMSPELQHKEMDQKTEAVPDHAAPAPEEKRRAKRRTCIIAAIVVAILVIALGVGLGAGLGIGLKKKSSSTSDDTGDPFCKSNPELCIGGALDAKYFSTKGVFNGTGIALAGESWNKNQRRIFTLYFQHHTGDIRFMQYTTDRQWVGGTKSETVASDAKNGTAISAVSYALNGTQYFNIFYISTNHTLRQTIFTNVTNLWEAGPLNSLNLEPFISPSVGLQACWKGSYYGDQDYTGSSSVSDSNRIGMNLWYPDTDSSFKQYAWYNGEDSWSEVKNSQWLGKSGYAGVGCYSWADGSTTTYAMMVDKNNDTEIWWKDTNSTLQSTDSHPTQSWQNTSIAIDGVYPSTSLGYTTYFYMQMADRTVKGYNVSWAAENTTIVDDDTFTITNPGGPVYGLGGTHLTVTAYEYKEEDGSDGWDSLFVFFQTEGDDISAFTRQIAGGPWTVGQIGIPDE